MKLGLRAWLSIAVLLFIVITTYLFWPSAVVKPPLIIAHGANTANWLPNTKQALVHGLNSQSAFDGVEVDIVLTKDHVPVLAHDPWIDAEHCSRRDQQTVKYTLIKDLNIDTLQQDYQCQQVANGQTPLNSIVSFDTFLQSVKTAPNAIIYLDLKIQETLTASSQAYAQAVFSRWQAAGLNNILYVEAPTATAAAAYQPFQASIGFKTVLAYPPFYADQNWTVIGAITAIKTLLWPSLPTQQAQQANADAVMSPAVVMHKRAIKRLHKNNIESILFDIDSAEAFKQACQSGVDMIITDYTAVSHCPLADTAISAN